MPVPAGRCRCGTRAWRGRRPMLQRPPSDVPREPGPVRRRSSRDCRGHRCCVPWRARQAAASDDAELPGCAAGHGHAARQSRCAPCAVAAPARAAQAGDAMNARTSDQSSLPVALRPMREDDLVAVHMIEVARLRVPVDGRHLPRLPARRLPGLGAVRRRPHRRLLPDEHRRRRGACAQRLRRPGACRAAAMAATCCARCCTSRAAAAPSAYSSKCGRPMPERSRCTTPKASTRSAAARATTRRAMAARMRW